MGSLYTEKTAKAVKSRYMHQQKLMHPGSQVLSPTRRDGQERTLGTRLQSMQIASEHPWLNTENPRSDIVAECEQSLSLLFKFTDVNPRVTTPRPAQKNWVSHTGNNTVAGPGCSNVR